VNFGPQTAKIGLALLHTFCKFFLLLHCQLLLTELNQTLPYVEKSAKFANTCTEIGSSKLLILGKFFNSTKLYHVFWNEPDLQMHVKNLRVPSPLETLGTKTANFWIFSTIRGLSHIDFVVIHDIVSCKMGQIQTQNLRCTKLVKCVCVCVCVCRCVYACLTAFACGAHWTWVDQTLPDARG